jgi:tyrosyl-DNA phosphodiesterase 1
MMKFKGENRVNGVIIMEGKKRSLEEYQDVNEMLKSAHEERKRKKEGNKEEDKKREEEKEIVIFPDGRSVFMTPINFISPVPPHFIHIRSLLYEDLSNIPNRPKTLQSALLTTFCVENFFIQPLLAINIPVCLVTHNSKPKLEKVTNLFTVISPTLPDRFGSFHAKLFLLKFPSRLRVVVSSANLINCDWSLIGQSVWFQDFFPGDSPSVPFKSALSSFLHDSLPAKYSISQELGINLDDYDFSPATVDIITSVPGRHKVPSKYGLSGFSQTITTQHSHFLYQCSSIGSLSSKILKDFAKTFTKNESAKLDLVFPSHRNVTESHLAENGAGVFFLRESDYSKSDFPKSSLCNIESPFAFPQIAGHLSHSKVMIAHNNYEIDDDTVIYIGSHNFSSAAWGRYEKADSQLFIRNYELGVVFKSRPGSKAQKEAIIAGLPFRFPPSQYLDTDRPWFIASDMQE